MKKNILDAIKALQIADIEVLHQLYLYRCLTLTQIKDFIYKQNNLELSKFHKKKISKLLKLGVVEKVEYLPNEFVLFLTTMGIDVVKHERDIPNEIFNPITKVVKRGYYRQGELRMNPRLVNHQVHLNQFVLEFQEKTMETGMKWKYFDEKHVSQYFTIRPDGLIQLLDTDFFLEMDMGTESKKQLLEKWQHYRDFIRSNDFTNNERKVMVLFITENVKNVEKRKDLVRFTAIEEISDLFHDEFDMVIGSKDELIKLFFEVLIPNIQQNNKQKEKMLKLLNEKNQFQINYAQLIKPSLNNSDYEFYIRRMNEFGKIQIEGGKALEFILDDYTYQPLSVINRIQYHNRNSNVFQLQFKRSIRYIVVVNDINSIKQDLSFADCSFSELVYFTTLKKLEENPFHEALFQFDINGNITQFTDIGLINKVTVEEYSE